MLALNFADIEKQANVAKIQYIQKLSSRNLEITTNLGDKSQTRKQLFTDTITLIKDGDKVTCINNKYSFVLNKALIESVSVKPSDAILENRKFSKVIEGLPWVCYLQGINICSLDSAYEVSVKNITEDENHFIVSVDLKPKTPKSKNPESAIFWIHKKLYRLDKYDVNIVAKNAPPVNYKGVKFYEGDYKLVKEVVDGTVNGQLEQAVYSFNYPEVSNTEIEATAKLSAYGFYEPEEFNTNYWYYIIFALIVGSLIFLLSGKKNELTT